MEKVRLETRDGGYVTTGFMPSFMDWPEMVIWGQRTFQLVTMTKEGEPTTYREVCCFVIMQDTLAEDAKKQD